MNPEIAAEAAVWVARLHGPDRSPEMELACRQWQARSAEHRIAFERCTETWLEVGGVTLAAYANSLARGPRTAPAEALRVQSGRRRALAMAGALGLGGVLLVRKWDTVYETKIGEQRSVVLADGTRMTLNTDSRVQVKFESKQRNIEVFTGEVLLEVAKDTNRPFAVTVAAARVVATGTAFVVRSTASSGGSGRELAITLVEGQVIVSRAGNREANGLDRDGPGALLQQPITMKPGDRVRLEQRVDPTSDARNGGLSGTATVDRPPVDQVLAWRRGEVSFSNTPLPLALAEMNRYSAAQRLVADDPDLSALRVSGNYRIGDNAGFAAALAILHGLRVTPRADRIELSKG